MDENSAHITLSTAGLVLDNLSSFKAAVCLLREIHWQEKIPQHPLYFLIIGF